MAKESNGMSAAVAAMAAPPANIDTHDKDMKRREAEHKAKRGVLLECLDPTISKYYEDRKDLYEWSVEAEIFRGAKGNVRAHREAIKRKVVAHNEQDAWAMFCDVIGEWPSYRDTEPTITRLKKRTLRGDD